MCEKTNLAAVYSNSHYCAPFTLTQIKKGNTFDIYLLALNPPTRVDPYGCNPNCPSTIYNPPFNNLRATKTAQQLPHLHHDDFIYEWPNKIIPKYI